MDEACKHGDQEISYQPRTLAPYLATLFRFYTVNLSQVDEKHGGGGAIITPTKPKPIVAPLLIFIFISLC